MRITRRSFAAALALVAARGAWLAACAEPDSPEAQVRAALAELEAAAEAGDVAAFGERISDSYQDALGHDKQRLRDFVRFQVLRNPAGREVVLRVRDVRLTSDRTASVMLHAGLAGAGEGALRGDAYAIDLDLGLEDDVWRVRWAEWRPAAPAELL